MPETLQTQIGLPESFCANSRSTSLFSCIDSRYRESGMSVTKKAVGSCDAGFTPILAWTMDCPLNRS